MAAIIVGLGGKAIITSRKTSLQQFIRTGSRLVCFLVRPRGVKYSFIFLCWDVYSEECPLYRV